MQNHDTHLVDIATKKLNSTRDLFKPIATQTSSIKRPYSITVRLPFEMILNPRSIDLSINQWPHDKGLEVKVYEWTLGH